NMHLGWYYCFTRDYEAARAQLQRVIEMNPSFGDPYELLGLVHEQQGHYQDAIEEMQKSLELGGLDERGQLGHLYAVSGQQGEAQNLLSQLQVESKQKYVSPYNIAMVYEGLGDNDQAFALLEKAVTDRDSNIPQIKVEPAFDRLRSDPRFSELLRRIGLPQ